MYVAFELLDMFINFRCRPKDNRIVFPSLNQAAKEEVFKNAFLGGVGIRSGYHIGMFIHPSLFPELITLQVQELAHDVKITTCKT
jgi:hypothetical protein